MKCIIPSLWIVFCLACLADEPLWTLKERALHRQVVVDASVKKTEKIRDQSVENIQLMRAVLAIRSTHKGKELVDGANEIEVYYETSPLGAGYRCPTFPNLKTGQAGRFYLRFDNGLTGQNAFVMEMGRDVQPIPREASVVLPKMMKAVKATPTFAEITAILGDSYMDVGSGIHMIIYQLDDESIITVGTRDKKTVLYVDHGGKRLYSAKAEQNSGG